MSSAIIPAEAAPLEPLGETHARAQSYAAASRAENTRRAYRADWRHFITWCADRGLISLPATPAVVALYLADSAETCKVSTLSRRLASISQVHQLAGHASPTQAEQVRTVLKGIRRVKGSSPQQAAPAVIEVLRAMVAALPAGTAGQRDRALLLLGFAGAFRRSELVGLDVGDVRFVPEGVIVTLRRSKTDQAGHGAEKGIPLGQRPETCPVRALRAWIATGGITAGPLFRPVDRHGHVSARRLGDRAVALIVKRAAGAAGLDPAPFSGHSLRAGLATSAAAAGVEERQIAEQTGHKSTRVLREYIRRGSLFRGNAAGKVGL